MKRKERRLLFRVINAISSVILVAACFYIYFWGVSVAAVTVAVASVSCIGAPIVAAGEGVIEVFLEIAEALLHALTDALIGIFEAIGNAFSSIS